jgi:hypothetical protein
MSNKNKILLYPKNKPSQKGLYRVILKDDTIKLEHFNGDWFGYAAENENVKGYYPTRMEDVWAAW